MKYNLESKYGTCTAGHTRGDKKSATANARIARNCYSCAGQGFPFRSNSVRWHKNFVIRVEAILGLLKAGVYIHGVAPGCRGEHDSPSLARFIVYLCFRLLAGWCQLCCSIFSKRPTKFWRHLLMWPTTQP